MTLKTLRIPAILSLFVSLCLVNDPATAGELSSLQSCVERGYKAMTDRAGIVAAVLDGSSSHVVTFGTASRDQLFEIGSITKTFTANVLAQSVLEGTLKLSDPIPAAYQKPGATITYQQLTTHTSGIRAGNFPGYDSGNPLSPYAGLSIALFKDFYAKTPLVSAPGKSWSYSNLGVSLLGLILSENAGAAYEDLVRKKVLEPLGLTETSFRVPDSQLGRFPPGRLIMNKGAAIPAPYWDFSALALEPAGGLRSTIDDMVKYARANLEPDSSPLAKAVTLSHESLYVVNPGLSIGMSWLIYPETGIVWHHGATGGFNSIVALSRKRNQAVVALTNTSSYVTDSAGNPDIDPSFQNVALDCLKAAN